MRGAAAQTIAVRKAPGDSNCHAMTKAGADKALERTQNHHRNPLPFNG